jgi:formamidopyrimidine-DNA glycosylase
MPELPEAETIARGLHGAIAGRRVERVTVHRAEAVRPMTAAAFRRALTGRRVEAVGRRGKWIAAVLDDGGRWVTQLRMTGRFTWSPATRRIGREPHLSVSVVLAGRDGAGLLRFHDVRRFGRTSILGPDAWAALDARLGLEPLSPAFTPDALAGLLAASRAPIRNALLDQRRIAGVGNVYANEACFLAGIDPRRPAADLVRAELVRLHSAIRGVLASAVERRGTSFSDYRDLLGDEGSFQNELAVYGRAGRTCRRCGAEIVRVVLAGRSAFLCPGCQR